MKCVTCQELREKIESLEKQNAELSAALAGYVSRPHSNTDLILGATLSGGDPIKLAKELLKEKKS